MEAEKPWYESRSIWSGVVSALSTILTLAFGQQFGLSAEQQAGIVTGIATIAGVLAVVFRRTTTTTIQ